MNSNGGNRISPFYCPQSAAIDETSNHTSRFVRSRPAVSGRESYASLPPRRPLPRCLPPHKQHSIRLPLAAVLLLAATMYHLLGIHSETMIKDVIGRDVPISYGKVIHDIIA